MIARANYFDEVFVTIINFEGLLAMLEEWENVTSYFARYHGYF
jgi:hypothetical protein